MSLFSDEMRRNPYPVYQQLRSSAGPVVHVEAMKCWMTLDYASTKLALTDHERFSSVVVPPTGRAPDWMIFSDPPRHTRLRRLVLRSFTPQSIAALEPRVRELSRALLAGPVARGEMDLVAEYAAPLPMLVIAEMLGIPAADRALFARWSETIMRLSYALSGGEETASAMADNLTTKAEMAAYLAEVLAQRRREPADDLLTRLASAEIDGEALDEEEILGFFRLLLAAGTETTTNLIDNAVLCLSEHDDALARVRADPGLVPSLIEEVLRYRSPLQAVFRQTTRAVELEGQRIPSGAIVLAMIGAANRDPRQFERADRFDLARDPSPHIAFGHGIHFCIGAALARLEARVALEDLLALPELARADDEPWPPRKALIVHGPASLRVRLRPS